MHVAMFHGVRLGSGSVREARARGEVGNNPVHGPRVGHADQGRSGQQLRFTAASGGHVLATVSWIPRLCPPGSPARRLSRKGLPGSLCCDVWVPDRGQEILIYTSHRPFGAAAVLNDITRQEIYGPGKMPEPPGAAAPTPGLQMGLRSP